MVFTRLFQRNLCCNEPILANPKPYNVKSSRALIKDFRYALSFARISHSTLKGLDKEEKVRFDYKPFRAKIDRCPNDGEQGGKSSHHRKWRPQLQLFILYIYYISLTSIHSNTIYKPCNIMVDGNIIISVTEKRVQFQSVSSSSACPVPVRAQNELVWRWRPGWWPRLQALPRHPLAGRRPRQRGI